VTVFQLTAVGFNRSAIETPLVKENKILLIKDLQNGFFATQI